MIEYKILIPLHDNTDGSTHAAREQFFKFLLDYAGGYTQNDNGVFGVWRADDGTIYEDLVLPVFVALNHSVKFAPILAKAFELFPDQKAIYWTKGHLAHISEAPKCPDCETPYDNSDFCSACGAKRDRLT